MLNEMNVMHREKKQSAVYLRHSFTMQVAYSFPQYRTHTVLDIQKLKIFHLDTVPSLMLLYFSGEIIILLSSSLIPT